jgi:putative ATP-dependent endonuclease of the OLD family
VHLRRLTIEGFRAAGDAPIVCDLPGRFSLLLGANGTGKTTISEAIYQAHLHRFPDCLRPTPPPSVCHRVRCQCNT